MDNKNQIQGYSGICRCCFAPIRTGDEIQIRPNGLLFHRDCIEDNPKSYYIVLERRQAVQQKKKEAQCITADQSRMH